jgi:hypothetical protein
VQAETAHSDIDVDKQSSYLLCCQQYPPLVAALEHRVPFFVIALHCALDVGAVYKLLALFFFGFSQTPQVPPALQYLQALQLEQA